MEKNDILTIKEFAELAGVTRQTVYKQLNNRLNPYCQLVDNKKMLELRALEEVYGVSVDKPCQPKDDNSVNRVVNLDDSDEVIFLRKQVEHLQLELEKEREHNREKDRQLLDALSKLADSQAALAAGQAAEKQKELADKIIEGKQLISGEGKVDQQDQGREPVKKRSWFSKLFRG